MKYQIERPPNPQVMNIHVDKRLTENVIEHYHAEENPHDSLRRPAVEWIKNILAIPGITEVFVSPYEIHLDKGILFNWNKILPLVLFALQTGVAPEEKLVKKGPTQWWQMDGRGCREDVSAKRWKELSRQPSRYQERGEFDFP